MYRVLIAEDDFRVAQIHESFLEKVEGMQLAAKAGNADETLKALDKHEVDLLLLDVYMPDELGTGILHKIRDTHPGVDIIMITAATDKAFLEKAIRYGVMDYLIKPVTLETFQEAISRYKDKKQVLEDTQEVNEDILRQMFRPSLDEQKESPSPLPTGIDANTLKKVKTILLDSRDGITSEEAGKRMGASRTTARRYLEYLVGIEEAYAEQVYGIVGRPERRYYVHQNIL
ncbi:response regulator [Thalassobacillus devorans]|uniref:response regulator n=1 Tax=Thalassobacillus devorans TaxID=279813 RepID=UPI0004902FD5|nr:response regulator [Thalassobacillus devorans]